jgi:hypothetical protein
MPLVFRLDVGRPLTNAEVDGNFAFLETTRLDKSLNLADLLDKPAARTNLGLGTFATQSALTSTQVSDALGYTPYNTASLSTDLASYLTAAAAATTYQEKLVSNGNIKTINATSLLGTGNIILPSSADVTNEAIAMAIALG